MAQLARAARYSHHAFTNLTGPQYGIRWLEQYTLSETPFESTFPGTDEEAELYAYKGNLGPGRHPFPAAHAQHLVTMQIDPSVFLRRLVALPLGFLPLLCGFVAGTTMVVGVFGSIHVTTLGFGATREYPPGQPGSGDVDSGPVVLGASVSATGFTLAASRIHGDRTTFTRTWATAYLFGAPVDRAVSREGDDEAGEAEVASAARNFGLGGPLGDGLMFALLTARPADRWRTR